jgi:hypothetical protein
LRGCTKALDLRLLYKEKAVSKGSQTRRGRRRARRDRRKALSPSQTRSDPGKDLYASIEKAIDAVLARHGGDLPVEMVVQALCLVIGNLALQEQIPKARIQETLGTYIDQVAGVMEARRRVEQQQMSPGGIILTG